MLGHHGFQGSLGCANQLVNQLAILEHAEGRHCADLTLSGNVLRAAGSYTSVTFQEALGCAQTSCQSFLLLCGVQLCNECCGYFIASIPVMRMPSAKSEQVPKKDTRTSFASTSTFRKIN